MSVAYYCLLFPLLSHIFRITVIFRYTRNLNLEVKSPLRCRTEVSEMLPHTQGVPRLEVKKLKLLLGRKVISRITLLNYCFRLLFIYSQLCVYEVLDGM